MQPPSQDVASENTLEGQEIWRIGEGKYTPAVRSTIASLTSTQASQVWADLNHQPGLLRDIVHVKFERLTFLYLGYNHIQSIECVSQLQAPLLDELNLDSNHIVTLRPLRKHSALPSLIYLSITDNPVLDLEMLSQVGSPLERLDLQYQSSQSVGGSLSWTVKVSHTLSRICIYYAQSEQRIANGVLYEQISKRHPQIDIY